MRKCEYDGCDNEAEYWDDMSNVVCEECMEREIEDGEPAESFVTISLVAKLVFSK